MTTVDTEELINLFEKLYDDICQAKELQAGVNANLKEYASSNNIEPKVVKKAFGLYKDYKNGKAAETDNDYYVLAGVVEEYFGDASTNKEN